MFAFCFIGCKSCKEPLVDTKLPRFCSMADLGVVMIDIQF